MTGFKHSTPIQDGTSRVAFWGTIILAGTLLLLYTMVFTLFLRMGEKTPVVYLAMAVFLFAIAMDVSGIVFTLRHQYLLGLNLTYYSTLIVVLIITSSFLDRTLPASSILMVVSIISIGWLYPRSLRRLPLAFAVATLILLWVVEWLNPAWRQPWGTITIAPIAGAVLGIIFAIYVIRQTWGRSMRSKLLTAFIGIMLVVVGTLAVYVYASTTNILRNGLENELTQHTDAVAVSIGDLFNEQITTLTVLSLNEVLQRAVEDSNRAYTGGSAATQAEIDAKDAQWQAADKADNNNVPLVREHLTNTVALELLEFQRTFPNHIEVFITDEYGGLAGTTNRTSDYNQADEDWWQAAYNNGKGAVYISEPEFDESASALAVLIALPLRSRESGKIVGILRTTYLASAIGTILSERIGETGETDLFVPGEVVSHLHEGGYTLVEPSLYTALQTVTSQGLVEMDYEGSLSVILQKPVKTSGGNSTVDNLGWVVVYHQNQDEAFTPVNQQTQGLLIVMAIILILAVAAAVGLSVFLVRPITQLTQTAEEVAAGNLNSRAKVTSSDEIGTLASTFNSMTAQLQETLAGLEQRVAARTKDLAIVAEVGTATSTILETDNLLQAVVDLTKERFNLYHSHIYLLDETGENLVLAKGAGEPGRIMAAEKRSIPLSREQSLVARAARERVGVTVNDVTQAADFLPNPLLPDTRSELAVPMIVGGKVIGVFDVQSDEVGRFTDSDINIQTTLAAQVATSIQNVRSFEQSKAQADLESLVNTIGQKIQRSTTVEDTLQIAIRELGQALGASRVTANIQANRENINASNN